MLLKKIGLFLGITLFGVCAYAADGGNGRANAIVSLIYNDNSSSNIGPVYLQLVASTTDQINRLDIFESCGTVLDLAVGPASNAVIKYKIPPGGDNVDLKIPAGSRISVKTRNGSTCSAGELVINALK